MNRPTTSPKGPPTLRAEKGKVVAVEFLPGRVVEVPAFEARGLGRYVVCKLARQPDGRFALIPQEWSAFVKVTRDLCRDLGLPCTQRQLSRLARAGFLETSLVTPRGLWVSLPSIIEHFHATRIVEGEPSWWTQERLETYYLANRETEETRPDRFSLDEDDEEEGSSRRKRAKKPARDAEVRQLDLFGS